MSIDYKSIGNPREIQTKKQDFTSHLPTIWKLNKAKGGWGIEEVETLM